MWEEEQEQKQADEQHCFENNALSMFIIHDELGNTVDRLSVSVATAAAAQPPQA